MRTATLVFSALTSAVALSTLIACSSKPTESSTSDEGALAGSARQDQSQNTQTTCSPSKACPAGFACWVQDSKTGSGVCFRPTDSGIDSGMTPFPSSSATPEAGSPYNPLAEAGAGGLADPYQDGCSEFQCGPSTQGQTYICDDGVTLSGPVCAPDSRGQCSWFWSSCL
jgi:hypothetical protein